MAEPVTARQNAIYDCTHIYLDAFGKKGPIGDLYSKAVAEYLERFTKIENCFSLPKNLYIFENGCLALLALLVLHRAKLLASNQSILALGVAPMRVVSRWCRCIVQRLCATDCKRPCLVRAAAPHSAPARMLGVYAQGLCKDAKPTKHTQPFPRGRGLGLGIENLLYFYKNRLFLQAELFYVYVD